MNWYIKVLKNYVGFSGRAQRSEYWFFVLFHILISIGIGILDGMLGTMMAGGIGIIGGIYLLAVFLPALAVSVRRLHDTGRSGWWMLLAPIPLIGPIVLIIFFAQESAPEANHFGVSPKLATA